MMIDYNVSDHWTEDEPAWVKSLVSSLDRHHGVSTVLPLTVAIEEITNWVKLASGPDAWRKAANRESLCLDLEESVGALGSALRAEIDVPLGLFQAAFTRLIGSAAAVFNQPPGTRTDAAWAELVATAEALLSSLDSNTAVGASWDALVATAQSRALEAREHRPIASSSSTSCAGEGSALSGRSATLCPRSRSACRLKTFRWPRRMCRSRSGWRALA